MKAASSPWHSSAASILALPMPLPLFGPPLLLPEPTIFTLMQWDDGGERHALRNALVVVVVAFFCNSVL